MKIFISSTFEDLKEHREAVSKAILRLGHQPIEMEDFGSRPETWNKAALNAINGCGTFVGIYAHRYGSIPKGETLSITEQEFDKAQALGIKCFGYRVDPNHPWLPKFVDSGEAKVKLDAFMKKIDDLLRSQFTTPDDLAKQVSQDLGRELVQIDAHILPTRPGSAPPLPSLIIGREIDLQNLKARLGVATTARTVNPIQVLTTIRGWPGVGKTTIAAALAHDRDISQTFPDGVLWTSLGPNPSLLSELATWGRALGTDDLMRVATTEEASARLTALLRNKRMFLIVDDVWEPQHAVPFQVGGRDCAMLITTRASDVAQALAPKPDDIYRLPVLSDENALELLRTLAPMVVTLHPQESLELVHELEGLPLALQVAGRLLNVEASYGFGVTDLILELRDGTKVLQARPPADRGDIANETSPTVATLFQKSTDRLDPQIRDCFAYLGVFAPKPATFDLEAMKSVWQLQDPKPIARQLVDRGLLEPIPSTSRFQMHALLVSHAKSLLTE